MELDGFTMKGFHMESLDYLHHDDTDQKCRPDNSVHVEGFELEHFVDAEPRGGLRFEHRDTKKNAYKQSLIHSGITPGYDAKKGVIYSEYYMN